jgi:hypothetical protein
MGRWLFLVIASACASACSGSSGPSVRISELLYHPVLDEELEDRHEFVEIVNVGDEAADLTGWRLVAEEVAFDFPAGTSLGPGEYRVIARDRTALAAVWGLDPAIVLGDYTGTLDNGGDAVRLVDAAGNGVDVAGYRDEFPWPVAADALGASEKWLRPEQLPLEAHRHRGHSLERLSLEVPGTEVANWAPSPLDGATPGRANTERADAPPPVPIALDRIGDDLHVDFAPTGTLGAVELEWFVDDVAVAGEPTSRVAMTDQGERRYRVTLPPQPEGAIVRYRVHADRGAGLELVSPRPTDPYAWHGFAITPAVATTTRVYHLYIAPEAWGRMWDNLVDGRDNGCTLNPRWDDEVPAVLVYNGEVFDVLARYQGSRYNRTNGPQLPSWPYPGPTSGPSPPRALSWHLSLPRYHRLEGRGTITLNKNLQGCPGLDAGVGFRLFANAGIPAPDTRYARLHINGGYYHYMLEIEHPGEEMLKRFGDVGRLYKSSGGNTDGAYGWGDERLLGDLCGLTATQRYELTYEEKTHDWVSHDELIDLLTGLAAARAAGGPALRAFFADRFDLPKLLDYTAIMNWSVPFDDMFQNHYLYRRPDGRWLLMPWDLDLNFGGWKGAGASLYIGEEGDPDNRSGWWNVLKDGFIKGYRSELAARMRVLAHGSLSPASVSPILDAVRARANPAEAAAAPVGLACSFATREASFRQFVIDRQAVIDARVPP